MDGQKTKKPSRIHKWAHDHKGVLVFAAAIAVILAAGLATLALMYQTPVKVDKEIVAPAKPPEKKKYYSPLTGVEVADEATTKRPVTAVMVENSPDARPQSGIKQAGIVYETIAEGGITRFIALYQEARPGLIGPVRSVRPYYVEWADAYDPAVAHIGGSARALAMIRSGGYGLDLDQFFNADTYWRATDRYAPHNVYTNSDKLDALLAAKGKTTSTFSGFKRKTDTPAKVPTANSIAIEISSGLYNVNYTYDAATNSYVRLVGGTPHVDREEGQIMPKSVVAVKVPMTYAMEDGYREQIDTSGTGQAYVFQDGTTVEATWTKADSKSPLILTDANDKEISLNRGQTWISAIPTTKTVSWQ